MFSISRFVIVVGKALGKGVGTKGRGRGVCHPVWPATLNFAGGYDNVMQRDWRPWPLAGSSELRCSQVAQHYLILGHQAAGTYVYLVLVLPAAAGAQCYYNQ